MATPDLNKLLSPDDQFTLNATGETSWIPRNPQELILPYRTELTSEEKTDLDKRRDKAREVVEGYSKIIQDCKQLEAEISQRCKNVKVPLNKKEHLRIMDAMGRIFGIEEAGEITFDMYKICVQELSRLTTNIPGPGDV